MMRGHRKQVLIVDDHPLVGECLTGLINKEPDLQVCAVATTAEMARRLASRLHPDVALVDLSLPDNMGLELIRQLRQRRRAPEVVVLTVHDNVTLARRALQVGARGYVLKTEATSRIVAAIRSALGGRAFVSEQLADRLLEPAPEDPVEALSPRELEVFELLGQGLRTAVIAERLKIGIKTVETHRARIMRKLRLPDAAALNRAAVLWQAQCWTPGDHGKGMRFSPTTKSGKV